MHTRSGGGGGRRHQADWASPLVVGVRALFIRTHLCSVHYTSPLLAISISFHGIPLGARHYLKLIPAHTRSADTPNNLIRLCCNIQTTMCINCMHTYLQICERVLSAVSIATNGADNFRLAFFIATAAIVAFSFKIIFLA